MSADIIGVRRGHIEVGHAIGPVYLVALKDKKGQRLACKRERDTLAERSELCCFTSEMPIVVATTTTWEKQGEFYPESQRKHGLVGTFMPDFQLLAFGENKWPWL